MKLDKLKYLLRHLDEINKTIDYEQESNTEQEKARKLVKLLERKRRKTAKIERKQRYIEKLIKDKGSEAPFIKETKYINCSNCKNPRNDKCSFLLCRMCCKQKIFTEQKDCIGHGLKFRIKNTEKLVTIKSDSTLIHDSSIN